jgi:hypothetical protein
LWFAKLEVTLFNQLVSINRVKKLSHSADQGPKGQVLRKAINPASEL